MKKHTKIILIIIAVVFGFTIISSIIGYSVTRNLTGYTIKDCASYYFGEDIEFFNNDGNIQINATVPHGYFALSDYTSLRDFMGALSSKNDKGKIYSVSISFYDANKKGICSAAVLTKDIYSSDWIQLTDTKKLATLVSMRFY